MNYKSDNKDQPPPPKMVVFRTLIMDNKYTFVIC